MNPWLKAARLRTLPLSISGIVMGSFLAASHGCFNLTICVLALLTTVGFQVISNFANDYGDFMKGTDNENRVGPMRTLQSGVISPLKMKKAIGLAVLFTLTVALLLIYNAFGVTHFWLSTLFFFLGIASIIAAIKYTVGKNAYGYHGMGDVFVFIFFGLLSVVGSYFLYTKQFNTLVFFPAISVGLLSVGVLNLNNMRDETNDRIAHKKTLVVLIGGVWAKKYHYSLLVLSLLFALAYVFLVSFSYMNILFLISFIPIMKHLWVVVRVKKNELLDPELKVLAFSTFMFSLLFGIGVLF